MAREEQKPAQDRLEFHEVRDASGRLLLRVARCGIVEVKRKNGGPVIVDLRPHLDLPLDR